MEPILSDTGRFRPLADAPFDLLVIGGGIIGCGIARDAALRGLRVALFEREDFGYGTSSRSTRLIHGGLRYLELLDFGLVRQDLREREILLRMAPHRVQPLAFLVPLYRRSRLYHLKLRVGLYLYDLLAGGSSLPKHRFLDRAETLQAEPALRREGLQGAALFYDAQVACPERLCMDNVTEAAAHHAQIFNHAAVIGLLRGAQGDVTGVTIRDTLTGEEAAAYGTVIVNAAGPWLDTLTQQFTRQPSRPTLRLSKGIHFAATPALRHALVLLDEARGRLLFVIPWLGHAWVGTTDTDFEGDLDRVRAAGEEVHSLQKRVAALLPEEDWQTVTYAQAGVRALVASQRAGAPSSAVSRRHRLVEHTTAEGLAGLISVLGGKLTAYRIIAEETVDMAARRLRRRAPSGQNSSGRHPITSRRADTHRTATCPLPGGSFTDLDALRNQAAQRAARVGLDREQAAHLVFLYGTRYTEIIDRIQEQPELGRRLAAAYPDVRAELVQAITSEYARTACDFLMRRTMLFFTPDQGRSALLPVVADFARHLGWSEERCRSEIAAYEAQIALLQAFRQDKLPAEEVRPDQVLQEKEGGAVPASVGETE